MPSAGLSHLPVRWDVTIKAAGAAQQGGKHPSALAQLMILQPETEGGRCSQPELAPGDVQ